MSPSGKNSRSHRLSFSKQPKGINFYFGTWTGRIILFNIIIYFMTCIESRAFTPSIEVLLRYGAKDPIGLAQGEVWRLVTSVFLHGSLVHLCFNSISLNFIAFQFESLFKGRWFLTLYLLAGIFGKIASAVFYTSVSIGASGAIFGLAGCGLFLERAIGGYLKDKTGIRPKSGMFTGLVLVNVVVGFLVPVVDNAAHIGGLVFGIMFSFIFFSFMPNRLLNKNQFRGILASVFCILLGLTGILFVTSQEHMIKRFADKAEKSESMIEKIRLYSSVLQIDANRLDARFKRGATLVANNQFFAARYDFSILAQSPKYRQRMSILRQQFVEQGNIDAAAWIDEVMHGAKGGDFH